MYLILSKDTLKDENEILLTNVVSLALRNRIFVKIEDFDSEPAQKWLQKQTARVKESWNVAIRTSISDLARHRPAQSLRVSGNIEESKWGETPPLVCLNDAVNLAGQPKKIVLENSRADRRFLLSMVDARLRARLIEMEENGSLIYVHGGGNGELRKQLEERIVPMPGSRFICWVLFDSDAPRAGAIGQDAQALIDICEHAQIPYYCLKRRAIENYIPQQALLEAFSSSRNHAVHLQQVKAFSSMTSEQRQHFHMKKGLEDNSCLKSGLYDENSEYIKLIKKGFKENLADIYPHEDEAEREKMFRLLTAEKAQVEMIESVKTLKAMIRSPQ